METRDPTPAKSGRRLEFLDGVRGIAALFVYLYHFNALVVLPRAPSPGGVLMRILLGVHYTAAQRPVPPSTFSSP